MLHNIRSMFRVPEVYNFDFCSTIGFILWKLWCIKISWVKSRGNHLHFQSNYLRILQIIWMPSGFLSKKELYCNNLFLHSGVHWEQQLIIASFSAGAAALYKFYQTACNVLWENITYLCESRDNGILFILYQLLG